MDGGDEGRPAEADPGAEARGPDGSGAAAHISDGPRAEGRGADGPADERRAEAPGGRGFVVGAAVVVLVLLGSLATLSHTEPRLRPADSVPTTTTTEPPPTDSTPGPSSTTAPTTTAGSTGLAARPARTSTVATVLPEVGVVPTYDAVDADGPTGSIDGIGDYGQRQVFLVLAQEDDRLEVLLPQRPNGSRGWVERDLVELTQHDFQIQVSLSEHRMLLQRGDEVLIDTLVAIGTQDTPTVGGDFYTWVLVDPTNAGYGSYAYGLSGFSTLEEFAGGDGRMAIHGTVDESSIGGSVSHGCIRVPDAVAVQMAEEIGLPLGVPVSIQA